MFSTIKAVLWGFLGVRSQQGFDKDKKTLNPFLEDIQSTTRAEKIKFEDKTTAVFIEINKDLKIRIII